MKILIPLLIVLLTSILIISNNRVSAHICFSSPAQRGPTPSLHPGDDRCYNRVPDCGSLPKGAPTGKFVQGYPTSVQLQQNLNHFYKPKPGFFDIAVSYDNEQSWATLSRIDDFAANNMDTQTFLDFNGIVFPSVGAATLRARYVSYNVNEVDPVNNTDAIFYSCSDIEVVAAGSSSSLTQQLKTNNNKVQQQHVHHKQQRKLSTVPNPFSCKTPPRWTAAGTEFVGTTAVLSHKILYDSVSGWMKWERSNTNFGGQYDLTDLWNLTMSNEGYTPQFLIGLKGKGSCSMFGGDRFFDWQYGPAVLQHNVRNDTTKGLIAVFQNPSNGFEWEALVNPADGTCLPVSISHGGNTFIEFYATAVSTIPPFNFDIPAVCKQGRSVESLRPDAGCKAHMFKK
jgi:hypothetical protein